MTLQEAADRLAIMDQIYRYCRSVDRLDVAVGHGVFHEDSTADFPSFKGTGRGWIDHVCQAHLDFLHHSHQVTNVIIELDGDRAGSESYVTAKLRQRDGQRLLEREFCARYVDSWSRRQGRWAIDRRQCVVDFNSIREVTTISDLVDGRRDTSDPSYSVLKGQS